MKKKIISLMLSLIMLAASLSCFGTAASAATFSEELKNAGFPASYISALVTLHNQYPNWTFKPIKTGLDWLTAIAGERKNHADQVLESGYGSEYYCTCAKCSSKSGNSIRPASEFAVGYYMDPRNWLDEKHIFQFESTEYNSAHNQAGVEAIIKSTWMNNANITYLDGYGNTKTYKNSAGNTVKYSTAIMEASKKSNLSAYYIAGRIVKEVGSTTPKASGVAGNKTPFTGIYNYYSIGASSTGTQGLEWAAGYLKTTQSTTLYNSGNAVVSGQKLSYIDESKNYYYVRLYSKSGTSYSGGTVDWVPKSAVSTQYFTYERPWTNPYKAIVGGAEYIAASYSKQYTPYLQKFNVNPNGELYSHEYMTNINAVSIEAVSTYNAYKNAGQLSAAKTFYIPVFNNMPNNTSSYGTWEKSDGKWYYYYGDEKATGWQEIDGKWYYFDDKGVMQTGWIQSGGKWYYFNTGGTMRTGWLKDNGKWYYLNADGQMVVYLNKIDGKYYYFTGSGAMRTGWITFSDGSKRYFDLNNGDAAVGFKTLDGKTYYFGTTGIMQTKWVKLDGSWYYFGTDGVMVKYRQSIDGDNYYFTGAGVMKTGWLKIGGDWYYYQSSGKMKKNGWQYINKVYYYFDKSGKMQTGWLELTDGKYYLASSGAMLKGWQLIDNNYYYFNNSGRMQTGFVTLSGKVYYLDSTGKMLKYRQKINGKLYYFTGAGVMKTGWMTISGNRYYFGTDGAAYTGTHTIDKVQYTFNSDGVLQ
ncbi:MAG: hypothetical protein IJ168_04050 [Eubacterium sp.]|nr:hypothetical protein [Eubacterium sp.]